eukprot:s617_g2.t1
MFRKLDPHGTGLLTEVQVELALQSLSISLPHQACAAVAFRVFDYDLSGSIDFLEFLNMMTMAPASTRGHVLLGFWGDSAFFSGCRGLKDGGS